MKKYIINWCIAGLLFVLPACSSTNSRTVSYDESSDDEDSVATFEVMDEEATLNELTEETDDVVPEGFRRYERTREFVKMVAFVGLTLPVEHEGWISQLLADFLWRESLTEDGGWSQPKVSSYPALMDYYLTSQVGTEAPEVDEDRRHQTYIDTDTLNVAPVWQSENRRFTTYRLNTFFYHGGVHPLYKVFYLTFDNERRRILSSNTIFKDGGMDEILRKLKSKVGARSVFCYEEIEDDKDVMEPMSPRWEHYQTHYIPRPALVARGVIFSYQPYEIDAYSEGDLHFVLPYSEVRHFLNPNILRLTRLN